MLRDLSSRHFKHRGGKIEGKDRTFAEARFVPTNSFVSVSLAAAPFAVRMSS